MASPQDIPRNPARSYAATASFHESPDPAARFNLNSAVEMAAKRHRRHKIKGFPRGRHEDLFFLAGKVKSEPEPNSCRRTGVAPVFDFEFRVY
jgi:hypothetical protein